MRLILLLLLTIFSAHAGLIHATLNIGDNKEARIKTPRVQSGISGFVIKHFNDQHSIIIANAHVDYYDEVTNEAILQFAPYSGLRQNSLPNGTWTPSSGDEVVLAYGYSRALLIAPSEEIYYAITSRVQSLHWVHPDMFATYLSYQGHPTPLQEDIVGFCTLDSIGLLYFYAQNNLYTMDCKSLQILQITPAPFEVKEKKLPFYTRASDIRAAWWGEGSQPLIEYNYHYMQLLELNNPARPEINPQVEEAKKNYWIRYEQIEKEKEDAREKAYSPFNQPVNPAEYL